ncbi:transcriptional regulator with XRE-family HTH domain [Nocardioides aromaticivorans]|uniref:Transcriptional regulator with XRE-family HTH domain n=1 Tax=Nocardioides aromaticivorans TaxID=200618 RepID=A0A7Y9ZIL9_9ACTN|nr:ArsR family transcriptional regulator [Nocardioides aromaticivorans]NYI46182.1 transcriptional regulator with XRE-family HTH domain [Nocardioides aromaticivorans]
MAALIRAGVAVRQLGPNQVELTTHPYDSTDGPTDELGESADLGPDLAMSLPSGETWTVEVKAWDRTLTPNIIRKAAQSLSSRRVLAIAPSISEQARAVAREHGWSVIATNPNRADGPTGALALPDGRWQLLGEPDEPERSHASEQPDQPVGSGTLHLGTRPAGTGKRRTSRKGRPAYGVGQVIRALLTGQQFTQAELAQLTGLSQPRISQTLRKLNGEGLAHPRGVKPYRWEAAGWGDLLDHWLTTYRGPGGTRTYWYGLEQAAQTADRVLDFLDGTAVAAAAANSSHLMAYRTVPALSGLVAADRIAPWARANVATIYTPVGADLQQVGLTPASPGDATIQLVVPADPGVWLVPRMWQALEGRRLADPFQILWDLTHPIGAAVTDADQAALHLRKYLFDEALAQLDRGDRESGHGDQGSGGPL